MSGSEDDAPGFDLPGLDLEAQSPPESARPYVVLARKYRPQRFSELIGQDAMVRTLGNAIARDRLAHAFLLTGVRGVGKTSTARLIAKGLNCEQGPTIDPCNVCEPCRAITEGRHIDVVEMDAASNTGVDDVREIIEAVRYSAVSARYKVYIIDEVHMLTKNAFNALLKTLEEPPPHVKFIFATTEIQKVPVTVLSRCQRFDLRRIPADKLAGHFARVLDAEGLTAEREALALVARAAEGSVRDGLSILDQAIAHASLDGAGTVTAEQVRDMLGLSDRGAIRRLFALVLAGDAQAALAALAEQRDLGVDPVAVLRGLLETCHAVTLAKVGMPHDPAQSEEERAAVADWAAGLSHAMLHRLWQMLLKGHGEVQRAAHPGEAADMAVLRLIHAGQMPDPGELARRIEGQGTAVRPVQQGAPASPGETQTNARMPDDFAALVTMIEEAGHHRLGVVLRDSARLVRYAPPELTLRIVNPEPNLARDLALILKKATATSWQVSLSDEDAAPTLRAQAEAAEHAAREAILVSAPVQAAMAAFPEAELIGYEPLTERRVS